MSPAVQPPPADDVAPASDRRDAYVAAAAAADELPERRGFWVGKTALVTGATSGLGRAIAQQFAQAGANVVLAARSEESLQTTAAELRAYGTTVLPIVADVTADADVARLVSQTVARFGRLDVLVNNVGRSARGAVLDVSPADFADLLETNFLSAVRCTRAAAPHLLRSRGHVVNIGSLSGKSASRYVGAYAASKFALAAYSQQLRLELQPSGVHVLLVSPGPIARDDGGRRYEHQLEGLPQSAAKPGAGVRVRALQPDKLAKKILLACQHRQPELVAPPLARLFFAIMQLWPRLGDWLVRRMT